MKMLQGIMTDAKPEYQIVVAYDGLEIPISRDEKIIYTNQFRSFSEKNEKGIIIKGRKLKTGNMNIRKT